MVVLQTFRRQILDKCETSGMIDLISENDHTTVFYFLRPELVVNSKNRHLSTIHIYIVKNTIYLAITNADRL